jgi:Novel STAND NTPase 1
VTVHPAVRDVPLPLSEPVRPAPAAPPDSPYKGLSFYDQPDAPFFFGREGETQVVAANVMASRLTVLYGESGVGKSSLLRAGAARHLMEIARENVARRGTPRHVVAVFPFDDGVARRSWRQNPVPAILDAVERAVRSLGLEVPPPSVDGRMSAQLEAWTQRLGSDLVIVLDQFEEYLLYHEGEDGPGTLAYELPLAVKQTNLHANFLISIREDMLARLDSFKRRLPEIFDNCVRVRHLSREDARSAIVKPLDSYNDLSGPDDQVSIEPALVDTLLDELEAGRVVVGVAGAGMSDPARPDDHPVETPYLQLVMTRLWEEERASGSRTLRLATLERLGHSELIVKTHLDGKMKGLPSYARLVAARAFHHLVTPSGSKIAHSAEDLAAYTGLDAADIEPVLRRLTESEYRILRPVARSTADDAPPRYEIFHDVLGTPILDWRARYLRTREVLQVARSGVAGIVIVAFGILSIVFLIVLALEGVDSLIDGLYLAWAASAVLMWVSTTIVLVKRWERREGWAVPFVGATAAGIGPVTGLAYAINGAVSLATRKRRRARADAPVRGGGVRRFAGVISLIGAGVVVLACLIPAADLEYDELYDDPRANYGTLSARLIASAGGRWFALPALTCVAIAVVAGVLALARPRTRPVLLGAVGALGMSTLAFFFSLLFWPSAFLAFSSYDGHRASYAYERAGPLLGIGGAGLVLVAAAPLVVVEIFAAIVGAKRLARGDTREGGVRLDRTRAPAQLPVALLGLVGAVTGLVAAFVDSGAWERGTKESLYEASFWAALPAVFPAAIAAIAAAIVCSATASAGGRPDC